VSSPKSVVEQQNWIDQVPRAALSLHFPLSQIEPQCMRTYPQNAKLEPTENKTMKFGTLSNGKVLSLPFSGALLSSIVLVAAASPLALGQAQSDEHQLPPSRILPSALEMPCHLWTVDVDDLPFFDAQWVIGSGNSVQVRVKGNFACSSMPSVSEQYRPVKGRCTRTNEITEAVYLDPRHLFGQTDVHVGFNEIRVGLVYHLSFAEYGTPLYLVGY
jgi:hypothetical protein